MVHKFGGCIPVTPRFAREILISYSYRPAAQISSALRSIAVAQILLSHKKLSTTAYYYGALSKKRREKAKQRLKELRETESKAKATAA